ncbi:hypothetical protein [Lyngbya sp. CCY1209]|uniref:hypothetical protein n=1 Tax=Lyngbya sp. CCY1209 TaxID=2886103 RepID=UPI002D2130B9|nr:hypothetical protein [Lyngbya sp. CCY1209]MEB3882267.1 hypothetical protein [Lyngbya sp. CCY1209]
MSPPEKKPNYITYLLDAYKSKDWGILLFNFLIASLSLYGVFSIIMALSVNFPKETASLSSQTELEGSPPTPETQESEAATEKPSVNPFSEVRFPMASCGNPLPKSDKDYPINFYPVFIDHSEANLEKIKSEFCRDSFPKRRESDQLFIQVSSFTDRAKAQDFADFLAETFGSAEVGQATVVATNPNSTSAKNSPSPSPTPQPRQARRSPPSREGFSEVTLNCNSKNRDTRVFKKLEIGCHKKDQYRDIELQFDNYGRDWYEIITDKGKVSNDNLGTSSVRGKAYILIASGGSVSEDLSERQAIQVELRARQITNNQVLRTITIRCSDSPLKVWGIHLRPRCSEAGTNIEFTGRQVPASINMDFGGDAPILFNPETTLFGNSGYVRSSSDRMRLTFSAY